MPAAHRPRWTTRVLLAACTYSQVLRVGARRCPELASQPIGGILSRPKPWTTIYLCNQPGSVYGRAAPCLLDLAPGGVYRAASVARSAGALLPHRFTLTSVAAGGLFSVALSRGSPRLAVSQHPALWSPDLPQPGVSGRGRPADSRSMRLRRHRANPHPRVRGNIGQPVGCIDRRRVPRCRCTLGGSRTHDLRLRKPALCPTELRAYGGDRRDLNSRPPGSQPGVPS